MELCHKVLTKKQRDRHVSSPLLTALDKNAGHKYEEYSYLNRHHDRTYVIDFQAAQEL